MRQRRNSALGNQLWCRQHRERHQRLWRHWSRRRASGKKVWEADTVAFREGQCPPAPEGVPRRGFGKQQPPPELKPEDLRKAARAWPWHTATQMDGINLKSIEGMSDEGLRSLAKMFYITDMTGLIPQQLAQTVMPAIPKPTGGHRLVGIFPFYWRLCAAVRSG